MSAIAQIDMRLYDLFVALRRGTRGTRAVRLLSQCTGAALLVAGCAAHVSRAGVRDRVDSTFGAGVRPSRVLIEPRDGVDPLIRAIDRAKNAVWVEAYFISQARIVRALERASAQGVDVRVLLERNP